MKIKKELVERTLYLLYGVMSRYYDNPDGTYYYKCIFCGRQSANNHSAIDHDDDCEIVCVVKKLQSLF